MTPARGQPWGLLSLLLSVLAWGALLAAALAFAASVGTPGDGSHGMQAMQLWILGALAVLVLSAAGSVVAMVMAWRRRRGQVCAAIAAMLLVLMMSLALIIIGATRSPALAAGDQAIWQVTGSRG